MAARRILFIVLIVFLAPALLSSGDAQIRQALVAEARLFIGAPYLAGGSSPKGSDCSGLTSAVYRRAAGLELPRSARGQYAGGRPVPLSQALPGDILCFDTLGGPSHVALYLGDNRFIHARDYGKPACVSSLEEDYYRKRFIGVRRYLPEAPALAAAPDILPGSTAQGGAKPSPLPEAAPYPATGRVEAFIPFVIPASASIQRAKIPALTGTWIEARLDARVDTKGYSWAVVRGEWKASRMGRGDVLAEGMLEDGRIPPFLIDKAGTWSLVVLDATGKFRASLILEARKEGK